MSDRAIVKKGDLAVAKKGEVKVEPDFTTPNYTIIFYVGIANAEYMVHKEFVCRHSPVLRKALTSPDKVQTYELPNATEGAFRLLSSFFYTQQLDLAVHSTTKPIDNAAEKNIIGSNEHGARCAAQDWELVHLYILAGELKMPAVQNLVTKHMHRISAICGPMTTNVLHLIYQETPVGSPLRRLAVHQYCWLAHIRALATGSNFFPKDMITDMAIEFWKQLPEGASRSLCKTSKPEDYLVKEEEEGEEE